MTLWHFGCHKKGIVIVRNIPSENDRKPNVDTRSTMKNWTSYGPLCTVLNTVLSRGHESLASVEVRRKPVTAKSAERTALTGFLPNFNT